jgi:hypothetical protein
MAKPVSYYEGISHALCVVNIGCLAE